MVRNSRAWILYHHVPLRTTILRAMLSVGDFRMTGTRASARGLHRAPGAFPTGPAKKRPDRQVSGGLIATVPKSKNVLSCSKQSVSSFSNRNKNPLSGILAFPRIQHSVTPAGIQFSRNSRSQVTPGGSKAFPCVTLFHARPQRAVGRPEPRSELRCAES